MIELEVYAAASVTLFVGAIPPESRVRSKAQPLSA